VEFRDGACGELAELMGLLREPVQLLTLTGPGGTGKTPLAILISNLLKERGEKPCFLTRGYGGSERGPAWVESGNRTATRFGDEPLLLANVAPTLVARNRAAGARYIEASGRGITRALLWSVGIVAPLAVFMALVWVGIVGRAPAEVLAYLADTLTNRLLHVPTQALRQAAELADLALAETVTRLLTEERDRQ